MYNKMLKHLEQICQSAKEVYNILGTGHSEAVYHKAMEVELRLRDIHYSTKCAISIPYKGYIVGYNEPDLIVKVNENDVIVVELKATTYPPRETEKAQLDCYLRTLNTPYGVLINFTQPTSKFQIPNEIHILRYGFEKYIAETQDDIEFKLLPISHNSVPTIDLNI
jgi:GxxExxY protein